MARSSGRLLIQVEARPAGVVGLGYYRGHLNEPGNKELPVVIVIENIAPFDAAHDDVLQKLGSIKSC